MSSATITCPTRNATPDDAHALCELINFAGEGLPLYVWEGLAEDGESPWDAGRRRARREEGSFSYRNAMVMEVDGDVAAGMVGYPISEQPEEIDTGKMPAIFVPLQELENLAAGCWYTDVLAAYPQHRGQGLGTRLLACAERQALNSACTGLAIIVSDANTGARRLYERHGYAKRASREMVKGDWENPGRNWVLLTRSIA